MITFSEVRVRVGDKYKDKTPGFRYGIVVFYSLLTEALQGFIQQLSRMEQLAGITKSDRHELIAWLQRDFQRPLLLILGFDAAEIDDDIMEAAILMSGQEMTEQ